MLCLMTLLILTSSALLVAVSCSASPRSSFDGEDVSFDFLEHRGNQSLKDPTQTNFWYSNLNHHTPGIRGYAPYVDDPDSYPVYIEVDPGDGDGIQNAIDCADGKEKRNGMWFASQPRVVYIPPGEYIIKKTIKMNTATVLMGDATNPPVLKLSPDWEGDKTLLDGMDPTTDNRGELSFAVGVKNIILDTTPRPFDEEFLALYWGVAQAAQLQNVKIRMPPATGSTGHVGIRMGRGSTLTVADVNISGGSTGVWVSGHQQALFKSISISNSTRGFHISAGFTFTLLSPTFTNVDICVLQSGGYPWLALVDATAINSGVVLKVQTYPNYMIENLVLQQSRLPRPNVAEGPGDSTLSFPENGRIQRYSYANTVHRTPVYGPNLDVGFFRPKALTVDGGKYPVRSAPTYSWLKNTSFLNIKDPSQTGGLKIYGDGVHDDASALNKILRLAAVQGKVAYFPFGAYLVRSTVYIPSGSRIIGEAWPAIVGAGAFFKNENNPKPVVQVGWPGEVGSVEIQDMRFTIAEVLPGAIIARFELAGRRPADVAMWNSMITVGGTRGASSLTDTCIDPSSPCKAVFMDLHLTPTSSVYLENVWNWVADHIAEDFPGGSNFAGGRGMLVESRRGTWLIGIGSEQWWLYQLTLKKAENVMLGLLQSETNYDQGANNPIPPPSPWTPHRALGDPSFSWCSQEDKRCRMGPATFFTAGGKDIFIYAAASWVFFSGPGYQGCEGMGYCQRYMHFVEEIPARLHAFGLCSRETYAGLRLAGGEEIITEEGFTGAWGGIVGRYVS